MKDFTYSYPTHVYFGKGALANALKAELPAVAKKVLLAYGGGSIKRNGIYEEVTGLLQTFGKEVVEFNGIMANPTYAKSRRARSSPRKTLWTTFWLWAAAVSLIAARL